ncbi:Nucleotide-diphospho-sugar transferases superfamily protein [Raphanus sativus]|nr:Nucleotide-diphospho-sugar transferases superfamily protein [Raphanus sativus]
MDSILFYLSRAFCTPFSVFVQIQGCVICLLLALGWLMAAYVRNREVKRIKNSMKAGNSFAFLYQDINELEHSKQAQLPRVSVIMPLKGFGEHNLHNWRSQITSLYGGPLEFLFVLESTEDPAYHAVSRLLSMHQDQVEAKVVIAGLATTCSQKIHNQLIGAEKIHKDTKYVLFLDDDVSLHPGTVGALTAEMEKNPEIFIQTGYPLDLPSGTLGSYCIYEYHMPCSMGFATGGRTFFLWGGCMMMHADDFRQDRYGVVSGLRDGGYSDDMTLASLAGAHKRLITSPPVAVFPHPLASDLSFGRYWNYLRKQTFVLESYISNVNWIMNKVLFAVHCYLSWGFVAPYVMAVVHITSALRIYIKGYHQLEDTTTASCGMSLVIMLAICTFIELLSMWNLTRREVTLCNLLSPEAPRLSLAPYNWGLIFIAMLVDNFLYPISAFRSHFSQSINWSGIRYHLRNGKVFKIERRNDMVPAKTDLGGKHLYGKKGAPQKASFLSSLGRNFAHWRQPKKFDL